MANIVRWTSPVFCSGSSTSGKLFPVGTRFVQTTNLATTASNQRHASGRLHGTREHPASEVDRRSRVK